MVKVAKAAKGNGHNKPFEKWNFEEIRETFGIQPQDEHPLLQAWLGDLPPLPDDEKTVFEKFRQKLQQKVNAWQEEELKSLFIGPLIETLEFRRPRVYDTFMDRVIEAEIKATDGTIYKKRGKIDLLVAARRRRFSSSMSTNRKPAPTTTRSANCSPLCS